jgi:hypothetical protein
MQIFTIVSGDYVYGAAALCNSLCLAGIKSEIHIGYTGKLEWEIDRTAPIITHELPKSLFWIGNYKPKLLMDHAAGIFLYVDADCVVSSGAFLDHVRDAIAAGPVFCAEGIVPEQDIRRRIWAQAKEHSTKTCGTLEQIDGRRSTATYFNSARGNYSKTCIFQCRTKIALTLSSRMSGSRSPASRHPTFGMRRRP